MRFERVGGEESLNSGRPGHGRHQQGSGKGIEAGRFREDSISAWPWSLSVCPPCGSGRKDIPALCRRFLAPKPGAKDSARVLSAEGLRYLAEYDWPGNIGNLKT
jgi:DNA-binding NtrC family response regulator